MTKRNTSCTRPVNRPRIYVACLAAYNNGHLHGCWIEVGDDADAIREEIAAMLAASPIPAAEEAAIHDYDGFESVELDEYVSIDHVVALAAFIESHGTLGAKVLANFCGDLSEAEAAFDGYAGAYESGADFAQNLTEDTTEIPSTMTPYIDYEVMARDMELNGDVFTIELRFDDVHVFWAR